MGKYDHKILTYEKCMHYVIKGYEKAIIQQYNNEISDEMRLFTADFVQSDELKTLYYEVARMIYYRQPLFWIRWVARKQLKQSLKGTCLDDVIPQIHEHLIAEATAKVMRGGHSSLPCYSKVYSNKRINTVYTVKLRVRFLEYFMEIFSWLKNVKFVDKITYLWGWLIKKKA